MVNLFLVSNETPDILKFTYLQFYPFLKIRLFTMLLSISNYDTSSSMSTKWAQFHSPRLCTAFTTTTVHLVPTTDHLWLLTKTGAFQHRICHLHSLTITSYFFTGCDHLPTDNSLCLNKQAKIHKGAYVPCLLDQTVVCSAVSLPTHYNRLTPQGRLERIPGSLPTWSVDNIFTNDWPQLLLPS